MWLNSQFEKRRYTLESTAHSVRRGPRKKKKKEMKKYFPEREFDVEKRNVFGWKTDVCFCFFVKLKKYCELPYF